MKHLYASQVPSNGALDHPVLCGHKIAEIKKWAWSLNQLCKMTLST